MIKLILNIISCFCLAVVFPFHSYAQYGVLDNSFNAGGKVITDISGYTDHINDVLVQHDGKIIICGYAEYSDPDNGNSVLIPDAARYNPDGTSDTTFNATILSEFTAPSFANSSLYTVLQQEDGKLLFFGIKKTDFLIVRANLDGTLDDTFDGDGKVITDIAGSDDFARSMIIQADHKLVGVGQTLVDNLLQPVILRYTADGVLDASFGTGGVKIIEEFNVGNFIDVKQQADGKLVAGGYKIDSNTLLNVFFLMRFKEDGTVDSTFGSNGKVTLDFYGGSNQYINKIVIQNDGKIIATGKVYVLNSNACVARFNSDGSLDASFQGGGKQVFTWGTLFSNAMSNLIQYDGKIVLTGYASNAVSDESFIVMRMEANGAPDNTFGTNGIVSENFGGIAFARCSAIQQDGKLIASGGNADDACTARFTSGLVGIHSPQQESLLSMKLFPNPASVTTTLSFTLPQSSNVEISLLNVSGETVATVYSGFQSKGNRSIKIALPELLPAGIYSCRLQTSTVTSTQSLVIAR